MTKNQDPIEAIEPALLKMMGLKDADLSRAHDSVYDLISKLDDYINFTPTDKAAQLQSIGLALVCVVRKGMEE